MGCLFTVTKASECFPAEVPHLAVEWPYQGPLQSLDDARWAWDAYLTPAFRFLSEMAQYRCLSLSLTTEFRPWGPRDGKREAIPVDCPYYDT